MTVIFTFKHASRVTNFEESEILSVSLSILTFNILFLLLIDLDFGLDNYLELVQLCKFPWLLSNGK